MAVSVEGFRAIFPEFADDETYPDVKIQFYLDMAGEIYSCSDNAQYYLAAHFLTLDTASGIGSETGGSVGGVATFKTEKKVGDLTAKNAAPKDADKANYMTTPYGQRFLDLTAGRHVAPRIAI